LANTLADALTPCSTLKDTVAVHSTCGDNAAAGVTNAAESGIADRQAPATRPVFNAIADQPAFNAIADQIVKRLT
jgi:hypothetical protein